MSTHNDWMTHLTLRPGETLASKGTADRVAEQPAAQGAVRETLAGLALLFSGHELDVHALPNAENAGVPMMQADSAGTFIVLSGAAVEPVAGDLDIYRDSSGNTWLRAHGEGQPGIARISTAQGSFMARVSSDAVETRSIQGMSALPLLDLGQVPDVLGALPSQHPAAPWLVQEHRNLAASVSDVRRVASVGLLFRLFAFENGAHLPAGIEEFQRMRQWSVLAKEWLTNGVGEAKARRVEQHTMTLASNLRAELMDRENDPVDDAELRDIMLRRDELESARVALGMACPVPRLESVIEDLDRRCAECFSDRKQVVQEGDPSWPHLRQVVLQQRTSWWSRLVIS